MPFSDANIARAVVQAAANYNVAYTNLIFAGVNNTIANLAFAGMYAGAQFGLKQLIGYELIKFGEVNYMNKKVILVLKKVIFTENEIIVKNKKEDVVISYSNIKYTSYHKKNFINYLLIYGLDVAPGWLLIKFKEKVSNRKAIMFKIDYDDLMKLPKKILEILEIN